MKSNNASSEKLPLSAFIVGCGRSGTTLLGDILSCHHEISYLFEPYYIWSAIDPRLDVLNLFQNKEPSLFLDDSFFLESHATSFANCVRRFSSNRESKLLIEKTPLNVFRIGWLSQVSPGAKFIHIVRDGLDVCTSIKNLATTNSYKIAGKPNLNQWWGNENSKWKALCRDGIAADYFPREVELLDNYFLKATYEWLLSLKEIDRWRKILGNQLYEITYDEFITHPYKTLKNISEFLGVNTEADWLRESVAKIKTPCQKNNVGLSLPPAMCKTFNQYQERYGFMHRAKSGMS